LKIRATLPGLEVKLLVKENFQPEHFRSKHVKNVLNRIQSGYAGKILRECDEVEVEKFGIPANVSQE
jgi:hypothetical protein